MSKKTFDLKFFEELADFLKANALTEVEYSEGDKKIRLAKKPSIIAAPITSTSLASAPPIVTAQKPIFDPKAIVKSPMVGIAYLSPSPEASAFVKEGDKINAGQTLLIIEAMKVMNPIKAPHDGILKKIFVENSSPVEFDEHLMLIEP